jgi:hypothetical protein
MLRELKSMGETSSLLTSVLLLVLFSSVASGALPLPPRKPFPRLAGEQKTRLREVFHLVRTLGPNVWPKFDGREAPVLLIIGEVEYLLNSSVAPLGFDMFLAEEFNELPVFARQRIYPPTLRASFPATYRETVVVGTAEQIGLSPTAWVLMVAHELFHCFQASNGMNQKVWALKIGPADDPDWHLNFPFPYKEPKVQEALGELGSALSGAVDLLPGRDGGEIVRQARLAAEKMADLRALLEALKQDARHFNYFRYQTGKEGVARYVEYRLAELAAEGSYRPLPEFAAAQGFVLYKRVWQEQYGQQLSRLPQAGRLTGDRVEFYVLGQALSVVLDAVRPEWKELYFESGLWLDDLLRAAIEN